MTDVKNKWALITGASRGIGRLTALETAKRGANLVLHSRKLDHCSKILEEVRALGANAYAVEAELSEPESVHAMLDAISDKGTEIDIVFNNAAVQIAYRKDYWQTPDEDYSKSFLINTIAPMIICYRLIPGMIKRGFGRVINTTSGIDREPEQGGYSASKAALDKVTRDLGRDLGGTGVIISLTDPGWCRTDLGGPNAPNSPESSIPGVLLGAFVDDGVNGRLFAAPDYHGLTLEEAVARVSG